MKRTLFVGALMLAATGSTLAADLPPASMPPPPPRAPAAYVPVAPPYYNWGGVYVGINGGYGFGSSDWSSSATASSTGNFNIQGPLAGGTVGANFQTGQFVFGIEGDGDWSNIKGSASTTNAVCSSCSNSEHVAGNSTRPHRRGLGSRAHLRHGWRRSRQYQHVRDWGHRYLEHRIRLDRRRRP